MNYEFYLLSISRFVSIYRNILNKEYCLLEYFIQLLFRKSMIKILFTTLSNDYDGAFLNPFFFRKCSIIDVLQGSNDPDDLSSLRCLTAEGLIIKIYKVLAFSVSFLYLHQ